MNLAVATAAALIGVAAIPAAASELTLGAGVDYSSGKYGGSATIEILYLPLILKYESGALILKLTVPRVQVTRPGSTTTDPVVTVSEENGIVVTTTTSNTPATTVSGVGDSVGAATYNLLNDSAGGVLLDATTKIKFATGDQNLGLSTGKNDYALQLDAYRTSGGFSLFATLGYKWMGKPDASNFRNVPYASVGLADKVGRETTIGVIVDYRRSVVPETTSQREMNVYLAHHLDANWRLQAYVVAGMSNASPDAGVGATIAYVF